MSTRHVGTVLLRTGVLSIVLAAGQTTPPLAGQQEPDAQVATFSRDIAPILFEH